MRAAVETLRHQLLRARIASKGAGLAAVDVAAELVQHDQQREACGQRTFPFGEASAQGSSHQRTEVLANGGILLGAAAELGYQVNLVGRALRKGRTATVGLLVPDLDNPFFSSLAQHLSTAFEGSAADVLVFSTCGDLRVERRGVEAFLGRQVDAVVMIPCHESESVDSVRLAAQSALTIQLDRQVVGADVHFVGCDNAAGLSLITAHIHEHVDVIDQPVLYVGAKTLSSSGHERFQQFTQNFPNRPTYLRVIGFDGIGVARFAHPTLTTVRQPVEEIGQTVLDLVSIPRSTTPSRSVRIAPDLILGDSSPA